MSVKFPPIAELNLSPWTVSDAMSTSLEVNSLIIDIPINQAILEESASALNSPLPTFDIDTPALYSDRQAVVARKATEDASLELHNLVKGPKCILTSPSVHLYSPEKRQSNTNGKIA